MPGVCAGRDGEERPPTRLYQDRAAADAGAPWVGGHPTFDVGWGGSSPFQSGTQSGVLLRSQILPKEQVAAGALRTAPFRPGSPRTVTPTFVTSGLEHSNVLHVGLPLNTIRKLQRLQNAAAGSPRYPCRILEQTESRDG